jgi:hypothetical protein
LHIRPAAAVAAIPLQHPPCAEHFTGRQAELDQLLDTLHPGHVVTLCGPGGIGKTALAAEALWTLAPDDDPPERFPDGIILHNFYNYPQAAIALEAIARAYGEEPRPTPTAAARRALAGRTALLVLDGAENADDIQAVLDVRGGCGVLITSRSREDVRGKKQEIHPLPNPEAVELLQAWGLERAADEAAARRICTLVGALPLAVRLVGRYLAQREEEAADYLAWLERTPLAALHFGKRQRDSVPVLLDKSVAQVSEEARRALGVVGVLALSPFGREAVAAALEVEPAEVGRSLGELVNYGLLLREDERYQVSHALVHTYARQRFDEDDEAIERLLAYYKRLVTPPEEKRVGDPYWDGLCNYAQAPSLEPEWAHLAGIIRRALADGRDVEALDLFLPVVHFMHGWTLWDERLRLSHEMCKAARRLGNPSEAWLWIDAIGYIQHQRGRYDELVEVLEKGRSVARKYGLNDALDLADVFEAWMYSGRRKRDVKCARCLLKRVLNPIGLGAVLEGDQVQKDAVKQSLECSKVRQIVIARAIGTVVVLY